ncbi:MAG: hypothetical protein H6Q90_258 [Deltaproteobacteria bacterium]|nr:hypothetical protein [Deltaproteobacteria bacterium]
MSMKHALPFLLMLAGCPSDEPGNAATLWLAPDGSEIQVKLVEHEPPPF